MGRRRLGRGALGWVCGVVVEVLAVCEVGDVTDMGRVLLTTGFAVVVWAAGGALLLTTTFVEAA